jgi:hypothetical protein
VSPGWGSRSTPVPGPPGPPDSDAAATPHRSRPAVRITPVRPPDETGAEAIEHLFEHWKRIVARRQSSTARNSGASPREAPGRRTGEPTTEGRTMRRRAAGITAAAVAVVVAVVALPLFQPWRLLLCPVTDKVIDEALPGAAPISTTSSSTTPPTVSAYPAKPAPVVKPRPKALLTGKLISHEHLRPVQRLVRGGRAEIGVTGRISSLG